MYRHKHFVCTSHMISHALAWLKMFELCPKHFPTLVVCLACPLIRTALLPCCSLYCPHLLHLPFSPLAERRFNQPALIHTALKVTVFTESDLLTGYEPNGLSTALTRSSLKQKSQNSMESLATRQEADLDDEQIRALLASPRYLPEREASAERSQNYHSGREGLMSSSS